MILYIYFLGEPLQISLESINPSSGTSRSKGISIFYLTRYHLAEASTGKQVRTTGNGNWPVVYFFPINH